MKSIAVKIAGNAEREPLDITIKPGTTCSDILNQLNLPGYLLTPSPTSRQFFGSDEVVYPQLQDGDKIYAISPADVGNVLIVFAL
jgi:hypothetical protein